MTSKQIIDGLMKDNEAQYQKKYAFEKGTYHQCIHNPKNPAQRITV